MRKIKENGRFFVARSGLERLIVNLVSSDYGWSEIVIRVSDAWEAATQKEPGMVPTT